MEILDEPEISEIIFRRYAQNPHGWSYTIYPARSNGFYDAIITGPEESWQLKLDTIFKPTPLVLGTRSDEDLGRLAVRVPLSFGYREMSPPVVRELGSNPEGSPRLSRLLASIPPVVPRTDRAYAHGPFVLTATTHPAYDTSQARVDERLTSDMLRLIRTRYPGYG